MKMVFSMLDLMTKILLQICSHLDVKYAYSRMVTFSHSAVATENILKVILEPGKSSST